MTSFQSSLGEGVAEELAESQRQISIAEFFEKNKHMLGFDSGARGLVTAVKEAVDNALDACEEAGIRPDIYIEIREVGEYYRVVVEDNGPGITKEQVPKVFGKLLYGSRFHKREQNRGQQGIGISAAVLYSQLTSGKPARITSRTQGGQTAQYFEVIIDTETNEPEIRAEEETTWDRPHGTRIELEMEANMRARQRLHDYIEHTAVVNPHARIEMQEPDAEFKFERGTDTLPAETEDIRPHPHGVELGTLLKMLEDTDSYSLSGFLQGEFTRVGGKTSDQVIEAFLDRYLGRELTWRPPQPHKEADIGTAVEEAVANKGRDATAAFASRVADALSQKNRLSHGDVVAAIDTAAGAIEDEFEVTFGTTVRENAVAAAWQAVTADLEGDLYRLIDQATTDRKDDATIQGLVERLAGYIRDEVGEYHRVTNDALQGYVDEAAARIEEYEEATVGETARENVVAAIWEVTRVVPEEPPKVRAIAGDRDAASDLLDAMLAVDIIAPPTDCLAPITESDVEAGLRKEYDAEFYTAATRDADVHGGDPFVVEAGIAYGGDIDAEGEVTLMRFANRVPLVYQRGACAMTDVMTDINWRNYGLDQPGGSGMPGGPAVVMVHVASTNVPFTSESKDAVANVPAIEDEIELALREAGRDLKSHINRREERQQRRRKRNVLGEILPAMAEKVSDLVEEDDLDIEDSLARIMNNVLIQREVEDGHARIRVENHGGTSADIEVTDIVSAEPAALSAGSVVEVDGEWFVSWEPSVPAGETAELTYEIDTDATSDLSVDGIENERLTIDR
ncbi:MAG: DNA topoisomerase VI subunit B [Halodesulfurarchaeum sp.]